MKTVNWRKMLILTADRRNRVEIVTSKTVGIFTPIEDAKLKAKLAEFDQLKKEIFNRSDYQHRILQIHVSALTLLLALTVAESGSRWILILIPIEASIFGLWWTDHAIYNRRLAWFILTRHEMYMDALLGEEDIISWERQRRKQSADHSLSWSKHFRTVQDWTFRYPCLIVLLLEANAISIELAFGSGVNSLEGVHDVVAHLLPMQNAYAWFQSDGEWARASMLIVANACGWAIFLTFRSLNRSYWALREYHREMLAAMS